MMDEHDFNADDEIEEVVGSLMTRVDCPYCDEVFDVEGDANSETVECPNCEKKMKILHT